MRLEDFHDNKVVEETIAVKVDTHSKEQKKSFKDEKFDEKSRSKK